MRNRSRNKIPVPCLTPRCRQASSRWVVYMLCCSDGSLSTDITNDLPKRLKAHAAGSP